MGLVGSLVELFDKNNRDWKRLSPGERAWVESNPYSAWKVQKLTDRAHVVTFSQFPKGSAHNNEADAFRHCFWSATLAREIGYDKAKRFTDLHELVTAPLSAEAQMDLHNNKVGLELGRANPGPEKWLIDKCLEALQMGRLKRKP